MEKIDNLEVASVYDSCPKHLHRQIMALRRLVLDTAAGSEDVGPLVETLKWGVPSYLAEHGSTIRISWDHSPPAQYGLYFHCATKLVDTFKELYGDLFTYQGNRAILFDQHDELPVDTVKHCILLSLTYHKRKHLPLLGAV